MPKRAEHDFAVNALRVVEQAIGEHMNGTALEKEKPKSKRSVGGRAGGSARAKTLTGEQKRQIAVKAAQARWKSSKGG